MSINEECRWILTKSPTPKIALRVSLFFPADCSLSGWLQDISLNEWLTNRIWEKQKPRSCALLVLSRSSSLKSSDRRNATVEIISRVAFKFNVFYFLDVCVGNTNALKYGWHRATTKSFQSYCQHKFLEVKIPHNRMRYDFRSSLYPNRIDLRLSADHQLVTKMQYSLQGSAFSRQNHLFFSRLKRTTIILNASGTPLDSWYPKNKSITFFLMFLIEEHYRYVLQQKLSWRPQ